MLTCRLALIGFGNVGQGFAQILQKEGHNLTLKYGAKFQIIAEYDFVLDCRYDLEGLDLTRCSVRQEKKIGFNAQ